MSTFLTDGKTDEAIETLVLLCDPNDTTTVTEDVFVNIRIQRKQARTGLAAARVKRKFLYGIDLKTALRKVECWNCRKQGHVSKDCKEPRRREGKGGGKGRRIYMVDAIDVEDELTLRDGKVVKKQEVHVFLASTPGSALADTGAGLMVMGEDNIAAYLNHLPRKYKNFCYWEKDPEPARFRFGDSKTLPSKGIWVYPIAVAGKFVGYFRIHLVEGNAPPLMSQRVMEVLRCVIDVYDRTIRSKTLDDNLPTTKLRSGHMECAFDKFPESWDEQDAYAIVNTKEVVLKAQPKTQDVETFLADVARCQEQDSDDDDESGEESDGDDAECEVQLCSREFAEFMMTNEAPTNDDGETMTFLDECLSGDWNGARSEDTTGDDEAERLIDEILATEWYDAAEEQSPADERPNVTSAAVDEDACWLGHPTRILPNGFTRCDTCDDPPIDEHGRVLCQMGHLLQFRSDHWDCPSCNGDMPVPENEPETANVVTNEEVLHAEEVTPEDNEEPTEEEEPESSARGIQKKLENMWKTAETALNQFQEKVKSMVQKQEPEPEENPELPGTRGVMESKPGGRLRRYIQAMVAATVWKQARTETTVAMYNNGTVMSNVEHMNPGTRNGRLAEVTKLDPQWIERLGNELDGERVASGGIAYYDVNNTEDMKRLQAAMKDKKLDYMQVTDDDAEIPKTKAWKVWNEQQQEDGTDYVISTRSENKYEDGIQTLVMDEYSVVYEEAERLRIANDTNPCVQTDWDNVWSEAVRRRALRKHQETGDADMNVATMVADVLTALEKGTPPPDVVIKKLLMKLHNGMGHCSVPDMVRILRHGGGSDRALQLARKFTCEICTQHQAPGTTSPAALPRDLSPLSAESFDVKQLSSWDDKYVRRKVMSTIDIGSRYHVMVPLPAASPKTDKGIEDTDVIRELYYDNWVKHFGVPDVVYYDPHGAHASNTQMEKLAGDGTTPVPCAGQAHWEVGIVERHGTLVEDRFDKYLRTVQPSDCSGWKQALQECMSGNNMVLRHFGYSPAQHLFGREPKLVTNLLDEQVCAGASSMARAEDIYGKAARNRMLARMCWLEAMDNKAMRDTLDKRPRPLREFGCGDMVCVWRTKGRGSAMKRGRPRWYGRGLIIGRNKEKDF